MTSRHEDLFMQIRRAVEVGDSPLLRAACLRKPEFFPAVCARYLPFNAGISGLENLFAVRAAVVQNLPRCEHSETD